jgi:hypothetical protein
VAQSSGARGIPKGKASREKQVLVNNKPFGTENIWVVLELTEGRGNVIVKQVDLEAWKGDMEIIDGGEELEPCLSKYDIKLIIQVDVEIEGSQILMEEHVGGVKDKMVIFSKLDD